MECKWPIWNEWPEWWETFTNPFLFSFKPAYTITSEKKWYLIKRKDRRSVTTEQGAPDKVITFDGFTEESEKSSLREISKSITAGTSFGVGGEGLGFFA